MGATKGGETVTFEDLLREVRRDFALVRSLTNKEDAPCLLLRHMSLGRRVVLRKGTGSPDVYRLLMTVRQQNLPEVYDVYPLSDGYAVLTEYVDGVTVAETLEGGAFTYRGAKAVLSGVGAALMTLHKRGFVHRDVKPENVVIGTDGRVVLIDFDIARAVKPDGTDTVALGTLGYAPPEQQGLGQSDPRTDVYALGVLLNVLLTRSHPSKTLAPGKAGRLVLTCTAVSPEKRFQTVEELLRRL